MKALVAEADWRPRDGYPVTEEETRGKRALAGSRVWRNPRFGVRTVPVPDVRDDEVLIRVEVCGICGSDTHTYETDGDGYIIFSGLTKFPCIPGHEFSGVVEKTGKNVAGLKKGDKVAVESVMWCGLCQPCRSGFPNQCRNVELMGLSSDGALAEFAAVPERFCWKINDLSKRHSEKELFEIGALVEPVGCAYNGIFVAAGGFNPGATVVVYGVGPIGLGAVALARAAGASLVIAFDVTDERLSISKQMGADHAFNSRKMNGSCPSAKVMELTGGLGADIQVEAAGAAPLTVPEMEKSLSPQGKIVYLGRAAVSTPMCLDVLVSGANMIVGSRGHSGCGIFPSIIRLLAAGRLDIGGMVTARFPFDRVLDALELSTKRTDGKILVNIR